MMHKRWLGDRFRPLRSLAKVSIATAGALVLALPFSAPSASAVDSFNQIRLIQTVYHVHVDGAEVGTVEDQQIVEDLMDEKLEQMEREHEGIQFTIAEDVSFQPERVFRPHPETNRTLEKLDDELTVKAKAVKLSADGETLGYVKNRKEANDIIKTYKLAYIAEETLNELDDREDGGKEEVNLENSPVVQDVYLSKDITFDSAKIEPDQLTSTDEIVKKLAKGTKETKTYVVQKGDVLGSIAGQFDLSVAELTALNPKVEEASVLKIGEKLKVTAPEPFAKVVVEKALVKKEDIPYKTQVRKDDSLFKGESKVIQEGKTGKKKVRYHVTTENGEVVDRKVAEETVLQEPRKKIVAKGTKVIPSRGTGSFQRPAVGGYISSYMGSRWGSYHKGIDIARPSSRTILAADNGTVTSAGWHNGGYGNRVVINHNNGLKTTYSHLSSISVHAGETVRKGDSIGVMGATGRVTGVHLHFEVYKNGRLVNPMDYIN